MKSKRRCAFCGREATLTGEHVWSDWVGRLLGKRKVKFNLTEADGTRKEFVLGGLNHKVNVVCKTCNEGWMSKLEEEVKPIVKEMILEGTEANLSPDELKIIAAWAFTRAIIADHIRINRLPFFYDQATRRAFAQHRTLPRGVQMWIARVAEPCGILKGGDIKAKEGTPAGFTLNVCTYAIGFLVVQITCPRWSKSANRKHHAPGKLTQSPEWDIVSIPFWPLPAGPIVWPAANWMTKNSLDTYADRWKYLVIGA